MPLRSVFAGLGNVIVWNEWGRQDKLFVFAFKLNGESYASGCACIRLQTFLVLPSVSSISWGLKA